MIEAILRDLNFWGQRPGLLDLPPVPVVELTGEEFGAGLGHMELMQSANDLLRALLHALSSIEIENALGRYSPASDYSVQPEPKSTERTVSIRDLFQTAT